MPGLDDRSLKESEAWNHMKGVVTHIVAEKPSVAMDVLESVSKYVLTGKPLEASAATIYMDRRPKDAQLISPDALREVQWAKKFSEQLVPPKLAKKSGEEGEEDAEPPPEEEEKGELPDIVNEQRTFGQFGEGLTEVEAFRVTIALKRLLEKEPLAKVRFWGKILGTKRDYFVAEGKIDEGRIPEKDVVEEEQPEVTGKPPESIFQVLNTYRAKEAPRVTAEEAKGVNEFKYYVATCDNLSEWIQLADVLPSHITAARNIHKFFSGCLDDPVDCHPPFPGVERHYLRAQIARISHSCTVCPKDIYSTDAPEEEAEDEDGKPKPKRFEVRPYEDIPPVNTTEAPADADDAEAVAPIKNWFFGFRDDELLEQKFWVHCVPQMLEEGRVTKFKPEEEANADEEEDDPNPPQHTEWINPFLSDLSHDRPLEFASHTKQMLPAWTMRKAYYNESNRKRYYLARSTLWPGAVAFAEVDDDKPGAKYQNIYIGKGLKRLKLKFYSPPLPPIMSTEFPTANVLLQRDCTRDDELEFEPPPPAPKLPQEGEEENPEEDA